MLEISIHILKVVLAVIAIFSVCKMKFNNATFLMAIVAFMAGVETVIDRTDPWTYLLSGQAVAADFGKAFAGGALTMAGVGLLFMIVLRFKADDSSDSSAITARHKEKEKREKTSE